MKLQLCLWRQSCTPPPPGRPSGAGSSSGMRSPSGSTPKLISQIKACQGSKCPDPFISSASSRSARWEPAAASRCSPRPRTAARLPGARREGAEGAARAPPRAGTPGPSRPPGSAAQRPRCHGGSRPQGRALSPAMAPPTFWHSGKRGRGPVANCAIGHSS